MSNTVAPHLLSGHIAPHIPTAMMVPYVLIGGMLLAYLFGSIPFGLILSKLFKTEDLRKIGSGNIGATNMLRAGGKKLALATLLLDMAKGYLAVLTCGYIIRWATKYIAINKDALQIDLYSFLYIFGFYAVVGHVWPIWLKGKGGKGVATALGVLFAFSLKVGLLAASIWLGVFALTLYSSLSALVSIAMAPFLCAMIIGKSAAIATLLIAVIIIYRHKENITRLISGSEPKIELKKP